MRGDLLLELAAHPIGVAPELVLQAGQRLDVARAGQGRRQHDLGLCPPGGVDLLHLGDRRPLLVGERRLDGSGVGVLLAQPGHRQFVRALRCLVAHAPHPSEADPSGGYDRRMNVPLLTEGEVYARIGEEGFARLVHAFYAQVPGDDILGPMYPADDLAGAEERLRDFLVGRFGGPPRYIQQRGHPRLRMRHMPFAIDMAARNRWVQLMDGRPGRGGAAGRGRGRAAAVLPSHGHVHDQHQG